MKVYGYSCELTPEEAASPFARYYALGPACPSPENRLATEIGQQIDPSQAFTVEQRITFWIGEEFENGKAKLHLPYGQPVTLDMVRSLICHGVWETSTMMRNIMAFWKDCQD